MGTFTEPYSASGSWPTWIARVSNRIGSSLTASAPSSHLRRDRPLPPPELVDRVLPLPGAGPQRRLALGVVPGRELATGERGAGRLAAGAGRESRERRLLAGGSGGGGTTIRARGQGRGGHDDLSLPPIAPG